MKYSHQVVVFHDRPFQRFWIIGVALFAIGNVFNFVALSLAPQSLLAPISSIQVDMTFITRC